MFSSGQPIARVFPPQEDYDSDGGGDDYEKRRYGDPEWVRRKETERDLRDREGGGQTMSYRTYYGPGHSGNRGETGVLGLNPLGYAPSNFVRVQPDSGDGIWRDNALPGRDPSLDEVFEESDLPGERADMGKGRSRKNAGKTRTGGYDGEDEGGSGEPRYRGYLNDEEEERRGRDFLKNLIEEKFLTLTTPLKKFVSRYLAYIGESTEDKIYDYIKVRQIFGRNVPIHNWDDLVRAVYQPEDFGGDAHVGEEGFTTEELADAIFEMVTKDHQIAKRWHASRVSSLTENDGSFDLESPRDLQITAIVERLKQNQTLMGRTARRLVDNYNRMVEGKVVFLLDNVLRQSAQSTLDAINAQGNRKGAAAFTLLEVMRSDDPLTQFLKLMILNVQALRNYQTVPMTPFAGGGIYGTLADRVSSNSANYQRNNYGGKTVNVFSRPTVANLSATSAEHRAGSNYFFWVVKEERDGAAILVFDPQARARELKSAVGRGYSRGYGIPEHFWGSFGADYRCAQKCRVARERKPVQSMQDALSQRYLATGGARRLAGDYDRDFLTAKEFGTGKMILVRKAMLDDEDAMLLYQKKGEIKEAYRVKKNPWKA